MTDSSLKAEKHQEYLNEHERLAKLFVTDRFAFEMERKRLIDEAIDDICWCDEVKERMRAQQKDLDRILKGAGSTENRLAMIQALMWHHVVNNSQPALQQYLKSLHSFKRIKLNRIALSLVKK